MNDRIQKMVDLIALSFKWIKVSWKMEMVMKMDVLTFNERIQKHGSSSYWLFTSLFEILLQICNGILLIIFWDKAYCCN